MAHFSEESAFVTENWETVQDIVRAVKGLEEELSAFLDLLGAELQQRDWWTTDWEFRQWEPEASVYISRRPWAWAKDYAVEIGIEGFSTEGLFGDADPPQLFVWCQPRLKELAAELAARLDSEEGTAVGVLTRKPGSEYVVVQLLPKCLSGDLEAYAEAVREQALEFIDHYAQVMPKYDELICAAADEAE